MKARVDRQDDDTWAGTCDCGFITRNHRTKKAAQERAVAHTEEHESGRLMPAMGEAD